MAFTMSFQVLLFIVCAASYVQAKSVDNTAKITLACLLGGIPAVSIIMLTTFCVWIRVRKRRAQKDALANGIELDADGWPVKKAVHEVELRPTGVGEAPPPGYDGSMRASSVRSAGKV